MKRNICFFLLISIVFLYVSCSQSEAELFQITPAAGHEFGFYGGYVTIKNPSGNTKLYYTVNGGDPAASGILNEEKPIRITADTTIKVVTKINNMVDSHVIDLPYSVFSDKLTDFALSMRIGWNLGKTMSELEDVSNEEIQTLLGGVKNYGFNLARIPLTWNDVNDETGLNKVFDITQSIIARSSSRMIVLISFTLDHVSFNGYNEDQIISRFNDAWAKIAGKFNTNSLNDEQNGFIVFEGFSELDRNNPVIPAQYEIMNKLNQNFVNTVRQSAGKNRARFLVLPVTNFSLITDFILPNDNLPANTLPEDKNKLLVSVNFFEPRAFTVLGTQNKWGIKAVPGGAGNESYIKDQFDLIRNKFTDQNIPVILSEYGAVHQIGFEDYRRYYMEYVTKYAVDSGLIPVYWDNGNFHDNTAAAGDDSADKFGLLNRTTGAPDNSVPAHKHNEVFTAMMQAVNGDYCIDDILPP